MATPHSQCSKSCLVTETELPSTPEKIIGNNGLRKRIIKKGISWQTPFPGDEVEVRYSMRLEDGEYFNSSCPCEKGTPYKFRLGQCEVIKGWDEGIATMRKGERAILTVPPNLAYGEEGSPPLVPPNSTIVFYLELLSWNTIRDISGDGGVIKKITREGEGWATPKDEDEVLVKFVARIDNGTVVSQSEEGVEFTIAQGYLCPAFSKAVKTMRKGEKAELSVKFSYGFGQNENRNIEVEITPNSNLNIHLELVSWRTVTNVTGDKRVLKKIIENGKGYDSPNEGTIARDGPVFEMKGSTEEPFEYICSEEQICEDLDRAIMTMKKGEKAIVIISCDFGSDCDAVFADSVLLYEVTLVDFTKEKPFWKMVTCEKLEACENKKQNGNLLFKEGKFQQASKKYDKALKYVEFDHSFSDEEKNQAKALRLSCNLNNAACKLKLGNYFEASKLCTKVIEADPFNVKALFRRSKAYLKISELEKAEDDIKRVLKINPNNRDAKLVYKDLKLKQKKYVQYEAEIFSTMLAKMS